MKSLRLVLGDQLTHSLSALDYLDPMQDVVFMAEVAEENTYVPHHKQKIVLVLSAMRHFADELISEGLRLHYVRIDDPANTGSLTSELARAIALHQPDRLIATEPSEWRVAQMMGEWSGQFGLPLEIREDNRFFCSHGLTCPVLFVPSELIETGLERILDMPKKRPTPEQIVLLLRQIEVATSQGKSIAIACREAGISDQSYYRWRKEYGGLDLDQARRMKDLEKENGRLKRLVADLSLEKQVLKDIASGNL